MSPVPTQEANIELPLEDDFLADEDELFAALRKRFPPQAFALLSQVSNATGGRRTRVADALALGLWPSRGIELHGFEIKRQRADWVLELNNPAKADAFAKFCHRWWVVAACDGIVREGELPPAWGLLVAGTRGLICDKEAPLLTPQPVTLDFVAALLRRVRDSYVPQKDVARLLRNERKDAQEYERRHTEHNLGRLAKTIKDFEAASGVKVDALLWDAGDIGEAVRMVMENRDPILRRNLDKLREQARAALATLDAIAAVTIPKEEAPR